MDWLSSQYEKIKQAVVGPVNSAARNLDIPDTSQTEKALGTAPEAPGATLTGGRRYNKKKTHKGGKRHKKTSRKTTRV